MEILALLALAIYAGILAKASRPDPAACPPTPGPPEPISILVPDNVSDSSFPEAHSMEEARQFFEMIIILPPIKCVRITPEGRKQHKFAYSLMDAVDFFSSKPPHE